jgi:hypothetical protein
MLAQDASPGMANVPSEESRKGRLNFCFQSSLWDSFYEAFANPGLASGANIGRPFGTQKSHE